MNESFFSIIIPIYNTAKFLDKCIKSIFDQKFDEFLHKRLEEIYNEEFVKSEFFKGKSDKFIKHEFIRRIARFKSCEGTYNSSYLQKNFYI